MTPSFIICAAILAFTIIIVIVILVFVFRARVAVQVRIRHDHVVQEADLNLVSHGGFTLIQKSTFHSHIQPWP